MLSHLSTIDALPARDTWGLDRVQELAKRAGLRLTSEYVHVVGTNGKGSTSAFLERMLREQGYRVGLYTSPHLSFYNERILFRGNAISDQDLLKREQELVPLLKRMEKESRPPSPFEAFTVLALQYLEQKDAELVVLEAGLGGRLDATNLCPGQTAVITSIDYDHTEYLGNTLEQIAKEKAGVIKQAANVVNGATAPSVVNPIATECKKKNARLYSLSKDFSYANVRCTEKQTRMDYEGLREHMRDIALSLLGSHQAHNASCSLAAAECLQERGFPVSEANQRKGLQSTEWPARLEVLQEKPLVVIDGAHNLHGILALKQSLQQIFLPRHPRLVLVFGVLADKNYEEMLGELASLASHVILTAPESDRALSPDKLVPLLKKKKISYQACPSIPSALEAAVASASPNDLVLAAGSLYLVGPARQHLIKKSPKPQRTLSV